MVGNETTGGDGGDVHKFGGTLRLEAGSRVSSNRAVNGDGVRALAGTVTVGADALVRDNDDAQCVEDGGVIDGPCPNPGSGVCP